MDLETYTDAELDQLATQISSERLRRSTLESIPNRACTLVDQYASAGGDVQELVTAVQARANKLDPPGAGAPSVART